MKIIRVLDSSGDRVINFDDSEACALARADARALFERMLARGATAFKVASCRHEVVAGLMDNEPLPEQVLRARKASRDARVRWSEVPMIPYQGYLP